jgi:DNA repair protein RadD
MFQFRDYQLRAIEAGFDFFRDAPVQEDTGLVGNPIIVMPTGTGKSSVIGGFAQRAIYEYPTTRVIMFTHVKELIEQNSKTLRNIWPNAPLGIYSAGLKEKVTDAPIVYAGIQSAAKNPAAFGHRDLCFIDECHLVGPGQEATYQNVLATLWAINPYMKVVGFTATDYRLGLGRLTNAPIKENQRRIFTDVAIDMATVEYWNWFIAKGYLVPPIPIRTAEKIDVSNVGMQNGDYAQGALQAAANKRPVNLKIATEICHTAANRRSWLLFCSGIEHCEDMAEIMRAYGVTTVAVHSKMPAADRDARIRAYLNGEVRCCTNADMLTTGFDDPKTDYIGMLRPSMSPGLWVQMLGRGTRPFAGKANCMVGDFARNAERLGPVNDPIIPKQKGQKSGDAPVRICDGCGAYNHASARICAFCGTEFSFKEKLVGISSTAELLRSDLPEVLQFDVMRCICHAHTSKKGNELIRVQYICAGFKTFTEYLDFEAKGYIGHKARDWWRQRFAQEPPATNADALLWINRTNPRVPRLVTVWVNRPYPEIMGYEF